MPLVLGRAVGRCACDRGRLRDGRDGSHLIRPGTFCDARTPAGGKRHIPINAGAATNVLAGLLHLPHERTLRVGWHPYHVTILDWMARNTVDTLERGKSTAPGHRKKIPALQPRHHWVLEEENSQGQPRLLDVVCPKKLHPDPDFARGQWDLD